MTLNIQMRLARSDDVDQLMAMDRVIWTDVNSPCPINWESKEQYWASFPQGTQAVAVVEDAAEGADQVIGYIALRPVLSVPSNQHVSDVVLAVAPLFQRRGVGTVLLNYAETIAPQNGKYKLSLHVMATNHAGLAFYNKMGFREQGRMVNEFRMNGQFVDDVCLYKWLGEDLISNERN